MVLFDIDKMGVKREEKKVPGYPLPQGIAAVDGEVVDQVALRFPVPVIKIDREPGRGLRFRTDMAAVQRDDEAKP